MSTRAVRAGRAGRDPCSDGRFLRTRPHPLSALPLLNQRRCLPGCSHPLRRPPHPPHSLCSYSTNADAFLVAVQDIAGASSGVGVVDQAKKAVNIVKVLRALDQIRELLKASGHVGWRGAWDGRLEECGIGWEVCWGVFDREKRGPPAWLRVSSGVVSDACGSSTAQLLARAPPRAYVQDSAAASDTFFTDLGTYLTLERAQRLYGFEATRCAPLRGVGGGGG